MLSICSQDLLYLPDLDGLCLCVCFRETRPRPNIRFEICVMMHEMGTFCWFYDVIKRRFSESSSPIIRAICPCILVLDLAVVTTVSNSINHNII